MEALQSLSARSLGSDDWRLAFDNDMNDRIMERKRSARRKAKGNAILYLGTRPKAKEQLFHTTDAGKTTMSHTPCAQMHTIDSVVQRGMPAGRSTCACGE